MTIKQKHQTSRNFEKFQFWSTKYERISQKWLIYKKILKNKNENYAKNVPKLEVVLNNDIPVSNKCQRESGSLCIFSKQRVITREELEIITRNKEMLLEKTVQN